MTSIVIRLPIAFDVQEWGRMLHFTTKKGRSKATLSNYCSGKRPWS